MKLRRVVRASVRGGAAWGGRVVSEPVAEGLEPRVLLSTAAELGLSAGVFFDPDAGYSAAQLVEMAGMGPRADSGRVILEWGGGRLVSSYGRYIATFDEAFGAGAEGDAKARAAVARVGEALGVTPMNVEPIARGRFAAFDVGRVLDEGAVRSAASATEGVMAVEPSRLYEPNAVPDDEDYPEQWHLENTGQFIDFGDEFTGFGRVGSDISAVEAWNTTIGSRNTIIAVIDSGVDWDHPDLIDNIWTNPGEIPGNGIDDDGNGFVDDVRGWDFGLNDNDPADDAFGAGHGTGVAGLIGATGDNGIGVTGVNWRTSILPLKASSFSGRTYEDSAILAAYDYVTMMRQRGVNIVAVNASYGRTLPDETFLNGSDLVAERIALEAMIGSGATMIASAGNGDFFGIGIDLDGPALTTPAQYDIPGLINVAATTPEDTLTSYSNFGATTVDLAAPASATLTLDPFGGYRLFNGTSAAAPIVSGIVGLLKSVRPDLTPTEIRQVLIDSSDFVPALAGKVVANGRVNAARALEIAGVAGPVVTRVTPGPITAQVLDTGAPVDSVVATFNRAIDPAFLDTGEVAFASAGSDGILGTGDDVSGTVTSVALEPGSDRAVRISLDTSNGALFQGGRLLPGVYRAILSPGGFRDTNGNFLNGGASSGTSETVRFQVVAVGAPLEQNDTIGLATTVNFAQGGEAELRRLAIGDGVQGTLDVDLFRVNVPSAGLITAEVVAQRLPLPSLLDAQIRLFDVNGNEIASNDQFFGADPFVSYFVATDGVYYIGVSGFGNDAYDPALSGSGASQSIGAYDLKIGLELTGPETVTRDRDLSANPPTIPADPATTGVVEDTLSFSDTRTIRDLDVRLNLEHGRVGDLRVSLISPAGTEVVLSDRRGGSGSGFDSTLFDDEAGTALANGAAPWAGAFRPDESLAAFSGESGAGDWTLRIEDLTEGIGGRLLGWSLNFEMESDIAGPFELNDTAASATDIPQLAGSGAATLEAFIGDGPFGLRDRDIFRFTADAGSTLTAFVSPTEESQLDASLRLFDDLGREILRVAPATGRDAAIDRFVISAGGTYYLGVAEQANVSYDPFNALSGMQGATSGAYTLGVTLTPGLSDVPGFIRGEKLSIGVGANGEITSLFGEDGFGIDYLGAQRTTFFGVSASGIGFVNGADATGIGLPMSVVNESDAANTRLVTEGQFRGLDIRRTISFATEDGFAAFDVTLVNNSGQMLSDVAWIEGINPNHGQGFFGLSGETSNDIVQIDTDDDMTPDTTVPLVTAAILPEFFNQPITMGFGAPSSDGNATPLVLSLGAQVRDAAQAVNNGLPDPQGALGDNRVAMGFEFGNLVAGASVTFRYFLFVDTQDMSVREMYDLMDSGAGTGHLAPAPAMAATETIDGQAVPTAPYRLYYPEGFANDFIFTYVPILNPNDEATTVYAIARYETGDRDQVIGQVTIEPNARGGLTISTPELVASGDALVRTQTPYGIELRSDRPVAATLSYYDTFLLDGARAAVGEAFTSEASRTWTFGGVTKDDGVFNFLVFLNTEDADTQVTTTFYPEGGGEPVSLTTSLGALRRGGWNIAAQSQILPGRYGVRVEAAAPIVAALTAFDNGASTGEPGATGLLGLPGAGALSGAIPEGQLGLASDRETLAFLNAGMTDASVQVTFQFTSGSAFRTSLSVPAESRASLDVGSLIGFPRGDNYAITYTSNVPVTAALPTYAYGDGFGASFAGQARTLWGFGEGFRPAGATENVDEYLRLYNPGSSDTLVEITLMFDNGLGAETTRQTVPARSVAEFDLHDFVTGDRRAVFAYFGVLVRAADPIVAYMGHYDPFFPGGFGTLGTPLGERATINLA